jgi:hypothetical protein
MILCPHNVSEPERCGLCDDEFKAWWKKHPRLSGKRLAEATWYASRERIVPDEVTGNAGHPMNQVGDEAGATYPDTLSAPLRVFRCANYSMW